MNLSDLAPIVAIDAIGAPTPLIVRKLAEAAHSFYRRTRAYKVTYELDPVPADTKDVTLPIPTDTVFIETVHVELGNDPLHPPINGRFSGPWRDVTGRPRNYVPGVGALRLVPYPIDVVSETLRVEFAVAPTLTATSIDDEPGLRHQEALILGAKARILKMPRKDWSDPTLGRMAEDDFERLVNEHRILARQGGSSSVQYRVVSRFK